MGNSESQFDASREAARSSCGSLELDIDAVTSLDDASLLAAQAVLAQIRRAVDACSSLVAGEIGHRSRRDLGYSGLAQREGFRTAEALVQHKTGSTARDASTLVNVGTLVHDSMQKQSGANSAGSADSTDEMREPWLAAVGAAVTRGTLSIEAAAAIRSGLGEPTPGTAGPGVTIDDLAGSVRVLLTEAPGLHADRMFKRARELRDDLDADLIADRERAMHEERSIRRVRRANGLHRYLVDPDLESAAFWDDIYDKLTSPRRGGARFVSAEDKNWADAVATDPRSTEQYVHDSITDLLRVAVNSGDSDSRRILGSRMPAVRVLVTVDALNDRTGHGRIEGCDVPISIETVERIASTAGTVEVGFDQHGQVLDLGREQRLFNGAQRVALAARDGGCRWTDCERPASWTEAHHIRHWKRDRGKTNVADGLLLCRHHHMLLHNNHWEIQRNGADYWLIPPPDVDQSQSPRLMPSKSAALRDLQRDRAAG